MKASPLLRLSLLLAAVAGVARADFRKSQSADLVIGSPGPAGVLDASDIEVDPSTQKVFVADGSRNRVLRFSSAASLQNGGSAEAVFGAADMVDQSSGTSATKLSGPQGICLDSGGRLWVADTQNNRVLRFDNAINGPSGAAASVVLGQPNFTATTAAAQPNRMNMPHDVAVDANGTLWVADTSNHRVIRFANAAARTTGVNADGVLGQTSLTDGFQGFDEASFYAPKGLTLDESLPGTVRLWVVDWYNNRVLGFTNPASKPNGAPAEKLLGQSQWGAVDQAKSPNGVSRPLKAAADGAGLWVADFNNGRALYFANAWNKPVGANADVVLGQVDFDSLNLNVDAGHLYLPSSIAASAGRLWVGDWARRIVRHDAAATKGNGTDADGILGARAFAAADLVSTWDTVIDPTSGKLFVADASANRVLRYASVASLQAEAVPEAVLGQPDFSTTTGGVSAAKMRGPNALTLDVLGNLWVADGGNNRVLRFASAISAATGAAAAQVLGQANFTASTSGLDANRLSFPSGLVAEWGITGNLQFVVRRLWVADRGNNRVLRFESPLSLGNGGAASGVLGAANFTTAGGGAASASRLRSPGALATDLSGNLWVADVVNNRVLRFNAAAAKANGANADGVLFQPDFTTSTGGTEVNDLVFGANGRLYATRAADSFGNHELVWFDSPLTLPNGATPDGSLGDPARIHSMTGRCAAFDSAGRLWTGKNSVLLRFTPALESRIVAAAFNPQNRFVLTIAGPGGENVSIRSSTDLVNWSTVEYTGTVPGAGDQVFTWTASAPPNGPQKYYRLQPQ